MLVNNVIVFLISHQLFPTWLYTHFLCLQCVSHLTVLSLIIFAAGGASCPTIQWHVITGTCQQYRNWTSLLFIWQEALWNEMNRASIFLMFWIILFLSIDFKEILKSSVFFMFINIGLNDSYSFLNKTWNT